MYEDKLNAALLDIINRLADDEIVRINNHS
jgi:hypothetical protein